MNINWSFWEDANVPNNYFEKKKQVINCKK